MAGRRHVQLTLDSARRIEEGKHGGWRPGAGRPKKVGAISHRKREAFRAEHPLHATLRLVEGLPSLSRYIAIIRTAIHDSQGQTFRIVEFNALGNHLHLIVEANNKRELQRGIQALQNRLVHRLNAAIGRTGTTFAERYHARSLKTPKEVRNALAYVLLNRKHHAPSKDFAANWIDPWSSAMWFPGWASPVEIDCPWMVRLSQIARPTVPPETWLLRVGWHRHGLLRFDERPR